VLSPAAEMEFGLLVIRNRTSKQANLRAAYEACLISVLRRACRRSDADAVTATVNARREWVAVGSEFRAAPL
jgi:hypothetical protein